MIQPVLGFPSPAAGEHAPGIPAARPATAKVTGGESLTKTTRPSPASIKRRDEDSPRGRLFAHWRDIVWPRLSEATYVSSGADFVQLAKALETIAEDDLRAALDRVPDDPFWAGKPLKVVLGSSALNGLLAAPGPKKRAQKTLCAPWALVMERYAAREDGGAAREYLHRIVTASVAGGVLRLEVEDGYRAAYVERHIDTIRSVVAPMPVLIVTREVAAP